MRSNDESDQRPAGRGPGQGAARRDATRAKERSFWRELPVLVILALGLALLIKTFLIQAFYIPSESMESTLVPGDRVLVNKLSYRMGEIQRGDVIVFNGADSWESEVTIPEPAGRSRAPCARSASSSASHGRRERLHQAGHRPPGRPGAVLRQPRPDHRQRQGPRESGYLHDGDAPSASSSTSPFPGPGLGDG